MKKYKMYWSVFNLTSPVQSEVVKLQQIVKGLLGTITVSTYFADNAEHAIWVGLGSMLIDLAIGCIYLEEKK